MVQVKEEEGSVVEVTKQFERLADLSWDKLLSYLGAEELATIDEAFPDLKLNLDADPFLKRLVRAFGSFLFLPGENFEQVARYFSNQDLTRLFDAFPDLRVKSKKLADRERQYTSRHPHVCLRCKGRTEISASLALHLQLGCKMI